MLGWCVDSGRVLMFVPMGAVRVRGIESAKPECGRWVGRGRYGNTSPIGSTAVRFVIEEQGTVAG